MRRFSLVVLGSALALSACKQTSIPEPLSEHSAASFFTATKMTRINGFVFDPEAFNWSMNVDPNAGPPQIDLSSSTMLRSLVSGADVSVLNESTGAVVGTLSQETDFGLQALQTDPYGAFVIDVPSSESSSYLVSASAAGGQLLQPPPTSPAADPAPPMDPPVPPGNYLPTVTLRRVGTHPSYCYVPIVTVASDVGVLQAVAKFYTNALGIPTQVSDFLDPTKFGGVIVWNTTPPLPWNILATAAGTGTTASVGDTYNLAWTMPGDPNLPPDAVALQSDRGYIVAPDPQLYSGVSVTLLPPSSAPTTVSFHSQDYTNDAAQMRPWTYSDATYTVSPGVVSYGYEMPDLPADRTVLDPFGNPVALPLPDSWRCVVDLNQDL